MKPAAKHGDSVLGIDTHVVLLPAPGGTAPTPVVIPFTGLLSRELSPNVIVEHRAAATKDSVADNTPAHMPPGGPFQTPPHDSGTIVKGSATVLINNKQAARSTDPVRTCNDPADAETAVVVCASTVVIAD